MSFLPPASRDFLSRDDARIAADQMVTPLGDYLGASFREGFISSWLGQYLHQAPDPLGEDEALKAAKARAAGTPSTDQTQALDEESFKASVNYRPGMPWSPGMTEARAAALASDVDAAAWRQHLYERYQGGLPGRAAGIGAQFIGGALSPENYIPFVGPEARLAMIARLGTVGGHAAVAAGEGLLGTALVEPSIYGFNRDRGQDYGLAEITADLLLGTAAGGAFGTLHGAAAHLFGHGAPVVVRPAPEAVPGEAVAGEKVPQSQIGAEPPVDVSAPQQSPAAEPSPVTGSPTVAPAITPVEEHAPDLTRSPRPAGDTLTPPVLARETDALNAAADALSRGEPVDVGAMVPDKPPPEPGSYIDVFHGTPHSFEAFDPAHIGSGEGKQAFGHGLYFAEHRGVAEGYQRDLAPSLREGPLGMAGRLLEATGGDRAGAIEELDARLASMESRLKENPGSVAGDPQEFRDKIARAKKIIESGGGLGNLLGVRLHVRPDELLHWDKPLSEQSPHVKAALAKLGFGGKGEWKPAASAGYTTYDVNGMSHGYVLARPDGSFLASFGNESKVFKKEAAARKAVETSQGQLSGQFIYDSISKDQVAASAALRDAGIPGIRYLDAGSRGPTEAPTHNIVLFDPARAEITHVNDRAVERPIPPPPSVVEAAPRVGKAGDELKTFAEDAGLEGFAPPKLEEQVKAEEAKAAEKAQKPPAPAPTERVFTVSGRPIEVRYEVVDAAALTASHTDTLAVNPAFPAELQPRDRTRAASAQQVSSIAANLQPELLGRSATAADGAPIVGPDGVVESGNGRVLALRKAFAEFPDKAEAYRAFIEGQGFDTKGIAQPVLIRRRVSDLAPAERAAFTREANARTTAAMSPAEQALTDAASLDPATLEALKSGDLHAAGNRPFVRAFLSKVAPESEMGALITKDGTLSKAGADRIQNALLARAYGDADLVARLAEEPESGLGTLGQALRDVAPVWARMRALAERGQIAPEGDGTAGLMEALQSVVSSRDAGNPLHFALDQADIFGPGLSPDGRAFLSSMLAIDRKGNSRLIGRGKLADLLAGYVDAAQKQEPGTSMFGEAPSTPPEILIGLGELEPKAGAPLRAADYGPDTAKVALDRAKRGQPSADIAGLYDRAPAHQAELDGAIHAIARKLGIEGKTPGLKDRAAAEEKITRKGYKSARQLTDVVRGGFVMRTVAESDAIASAVAKRFPIIDEGFKATPAGYVDRKLMVLFDDGTIGELQLIPAEMAHAKTNKAKGGLGGHELYDESRSLPMDDPRVAELEAEQRAIYAGALARSDASIREIASSPPAPATRRPNMRENVASSTGLPESDTSAGWTSVQDLSQSSANPSTAQAREPVVTAGRPSQLTNRNSDIATSNIHVGSGPEFPTPLDGELQALRDAGRLTPDDEAALAAAEREATDAERYATAFETLPNCVNRFG